jgi:hypothetical protein
MSILKKQLQKVQEENTSTKTGWQIFFLFLTLLKTRTFKEHFWNSQQKVLQMIRKTETSPHL